MFKENGYLKSGRLSYSLLSKIHPVWFADDWKFTPFNGQIQRIRDILQIVEIFSPDVCIETGTYLGSTTGFLAALSPGGVKTIEINSTYLQTAELRFSKNHSSSRIQTYLGDSASTIAEVLSDIPTTQKIMAYLDAHWLDAIPTRQEIEALEAWGGEWVAIIDDFKVSSDIGFGYDSYGDVQIGPELLGGLPDLEIRGPSRNSIVETGAKRGTGYVLNKNKVNNFEKILLGLVKLSK